jgi:hypothetical protein
VEVACFAYHSWYDFYFKAYFVWLYDGLFERFVYVIYVVYGVYCVVVSGVLTFYDLEASPSFICDVFH